MAGSCERCLASYRDCRTNVLVTSIYTFASTRKDLNQNVPSGQEQSMSVQTTIGVGGRDVKRRSSLAGGSLKGRARARRASTTRYVMGQHSIVDLLFFTAEVLEQERKLAFLILPGNLHKQDCKHTCNAECIYGFINRAYTLNTFEFLSQEAAL